MNPTDQYFAQGPNCPVFLAGREIPNALRCILPRDHDMRRPGAQHRAFDKDGHEVLWPERRKVLSA